MEPRYIQANTDGLLHDARTPSLAPLDRGFLYGDAIYEVWRTYHGVLFAFDEHWARLQRSAGALQLQLPLDRATLLAEIRRTVAAFIERAGSADPLYIRLQVTRGGGAIGLDIGLAGAPTFVLLVQQLALPPWASIRAGLTLSVARELRRNPIAALNPAWKTGNYLNNLLCLREARGRGADEVLILNQAGAVTEAAVANIFFVRDQALTTPPLNDGLLGGVTRAWVLTQIAPRLGIVAVEDTVLGAAIDQYDSCFLASTTRDLVPVRAIDGHRYPVDDSQVVWRLKAAFQDCAAAYAAAHPELRLTAG